MIPHFTADEIEERRPIWVALSDLYLDTDSRLSYAYIARTLAVSRFTIEELHVILNEEIAPVLEHNLLQVAGEWAGFDETWLVDRILARQGRKRRMWLLVNMQDEWQCIAQLTSILRALPAAAQSARAQAWHALIMLFVDKQPTCRPSTAFTLQELESFFRNDLWPLLIEGSRKLARRNTMYHPNEQEIEANWLAFAATIR